jgi:cytochrome b involved in lipid metabolism
MNKKIIAVVILLIAAVAVAALALPKNNKSNTANTVVTVSTPDASDGTTGEQAGLPTYTAADVAKHATKADCWTIISGSVYNITDFIPQHPGGDEILRACGTDATTLFTTRHTADGEAVGSGTPHSDTAESLLAQMKIGDLNQ